MANAQVLATELLGKSDEVALEKALEQSGCLQKSKPDAADSSSLDDFRVSPACLDKLPQVSSKDTSDPVEIALLAAKAYIWGLGPEYIERFSKYNTIIGAPFNALKYGAVPAAWNNERQTRGMLPCCISADS